MKLRELTGWSVGAIALAVVGVSIGVAALITLNPFLALFGLTIVCAGGVSAMIGLQEKP